jgi:portal protein
MKQEQEAVTASLPGYVGGVTDPSTLPFSSPWSNNDLQRLVAEDIFGSDLPLNTRQAAMEVPAVARGRNLICSTIPRFPLVDLDVGEQVPTRPDFAAIAELPARQSALDEYRAAMSAFRNRQPTWLYRSDDGTSPQLRLAWTIDDLIFYGWSCWWRRNDATSRYPLSAGRIPFGDWSINADNRVEVHGVVQNDDQVIVIPGLHEGILSFGRRAIADARSLYDIVRSRLLTPSPQLNLHQVDGPDMTDDEIDALIDRWATARQGGKGGVGFTSKHIELDELGAAADSQLMIEARNAASLDLARVIGVSANRLDATSAKASLNYETTTGRNQEFIDFDIALYMTPITARLSMDDVSPRGHRTEFDLTDFVTNAPSMTTGATTSD